MPLVLNTREIQQQLRAAGQQFGSGSTGVVKVLVDTTGVVRKVQIEESTRSHTLDAEVASIAWTMTFRPATLDGRPRQVWAAITYSFETDCDQYTLSQRRRLSGTHPCAA